MERSLVRAFTLPHQVRLYSPPTVPKMSPNNLYPYVPFLLTTFSFKFKLKQI